jgi:hypothetical protein
MVSKASPSAGGAGSGGDGDDRDIEALRSELNRLIAVLAEIQANVDTDQNAAILALRADMEKLIGLVSQSNSERELAAAGLGNLDNVLLNGFSILSQQLLPLRDLTPYREKLSEMQAARLSFLLTAHRQQEWGGGGPLGVREDVIKFIGEELVPLGQGSGPSSPSGPSFAFVAP